MESHHIIEKRKVRVLHALFNTARIALPFARSR